MTLVVIVGIQVLLAMLVIGTIGGVGSRRA
jgi:hypothetical protein